MRVKNFIREFKESGKDGQVAITGENLNNIVSSLLLPKNRKANPEEFKQDQAILRDFLQSNKGSKAIYKACKSGIYNIPKGMTTVLGIALSMMRPDEDNEKIFERYTTIIDFLIGKESKKIAKDYDIGTATVKNLKMEMPETLDKVDDKRLAYAYIRRLINKMYIIGKTKGGEDICKDNIFELMDSLVGTSHQLHVVFFILLERNERVARLCGEGELAMYNLLTHYALSYLNSGKTKEICEALMTFYVRKRMTDKSFDNDAARRVSLADLSEDNYPKIVKATSLLIENAEEYKLTSETMKEFLS